MKKTPERSCIGCGRKGEKSSFLRIVRVREKPSVNHTEEDGNIQIDRTGRMNGRGAYLCDNAECLSLAVRRHSVERAFHCKVRPGVYDELLEALTVR